MRSTLGTVLKKNLIIPLLYIFYQYITPFRAWSSMEKFTTQAKTALEKEGVDARPNMAIIATRRL